MNLPKREKSCIYVVGVEKVTERAQSDNVVLLIHVVFSCLNAHISHVAPASVGLQKEIVTERGNYMIKRWQDDELLDLAEDHRLKLGILITIDKDNTITMAIRQHRDVKSPKIDALVMRVADIMYGDLKTANTLPI